MSGMLRLAVLVVALAVQSTDTPPLGRVVLHAHNCFPEHGRWANRIERALGTAIRPIAIEQDVEWFVDPASGRGRAVLSHGETPTGSEPTVEEYFFTRVAPLLDRALAERQTGTWPIVYLHFNFRDSNPVFLQSVWDLLGRHERWLTTAPKTADDGRVMPLTLGPLMVLTESGQETVFNDRVPAGGRLRVFGTMPAGRPAGVARDDREAQATALAAASPEVLIPGRATNYQRWINFPWGAVERGGPPRAGEWTDADAARLKALVDRAHAMGLMIRFYTLNGHAPAAGQGWGDGYNFGSLDAVRPRWRAAIRAGVDLLATDQYELLGEQLASAARP
jgi:hypothetical protein